jgi:hypothetical protein
MKLLDHTVRIFRLAAVFALGGMVVACGGGGGGGVAGDNSGGTATSSTLLPGIYTGSLRVQGTSSDNTWVTLLTSDSKWYGWEQTAGGEVALYSGSLDQAPPTGLISSVVAYKNGALRSGQASLTGVSSRGYSANLTLDRVTTPTFLAEELRVGTLSAQTSASFEGLNPLVGTWTGNWRDGPTDSDLDATIAIQSSGQVSFSAFTDCAQSSASASRVNRLSGLPAFSVEFRFSAATICRWKGKLLSGVAILRPSTESGKTWQLDLMATETSGGGISFRASR